MIIDTNTSDTCSDTFSALSRPLKIQVAHLLLAILWNLTGVVLISLDKAPLGPTASLSGAATMLVLIGLLILGTRQYRWLYVASSLFILFTLSSVIWAAFNSNPQLWPSDFSRYSGVAINSLGVLGALWGLSIMFRSLTTNTE